MPAENVSLNISGQGTFSPISSIAVAKTAKLDQQNY